MLDTDAWLDLIKVMDLLHCRLRGAFSCVEVCLSDAVRRSNTLFFTCPVSYFCLSMTLVYTSILRDSIYAQTLFYVQFVLEFLPFFSINRKCFSITRGTSSTLYRLYVITRICTEIHDLKASKCILFYSFFWVGEFSPQILSNN